MHLQQVALVRILIVDDDPDICDMISQYLNGRGCRTRSVNAVPSARLALAAESFDVLVLDIAMPDSDGLEFLAEVKEEHPNLPVVMFTGLGYREDLMRDALEMGASGYVTKGQPISQLLMEIHRVLKGR